ncbi:YybH family protein [Chitinophaga sp. Hz27]|uniref:YybH family protein n=1 Tax=Chitinophaga sp. Hz27 TaxID=3347169 RepID=UPI0035DB7397
MRFLVLLISFLTLVRFANAQPATAYYQQFNAIEQQLDDAWATRDVGKIMSFYTYKAVRMPEYSPTLLGRSAIESYIRAWMDAATVSNCSHEIKDIQVIKNHLIEIGTAKATVLLGKNPPYLYESKYLHVWDISNPQRPLLVAEIQGSVKDLARNILPVIDIPQKATPTPSRSSLLQRLNEKNEIFVHNVMTANGAAMAALYTADAIYMPYFRDLITGREAINKYYVEHESPAVAKDPVKINISSLTDLGDFVIVNGFYHVHWKDGANEGNVDGKSINIWKKDDNGDYKMFRQMVVHD